MKTSTYLPGITVLGILAMAGVDRPAVAQYGSGWAPVPAPVENRGGPFLYDAPAYPPMNPAYPPPYAEQPYGPSYADPYQPRPGSRAVYALPGLSAELVTEVHAFLRAFSRTAHIVPQGRSMQRDAERLYESALAFHQTVTSGGNPRQIGSMMRDMEAAYNNLARRVDRVARGRTGPNIQHIQTIGFILSELLSTAAVSDIAPGRVTPRVRY